MLIDKAEIVTGGITKAYDVVSDRPLGAKDGYPLFPAIAIPVETKGEFECPDIHLDELTRYLPEVDRILIIGWRGADQHFVTLLKSKLRRSPNVLVVSGSDDGAQETIRVLQAAGIDGVFSGFGTGFTSFIEARGLDGFLPKRQPPAS